MPEAVTYRLGDNFEMFIICNGKSIHLHKAVSGIRGL